jgi:hypothetical protein
VPDLEAELDELYGAPLDEFTARRNDLARRLRGAGQDEPAERVADLRKPSVPVWVVNQLARSQPKAVSALVAAAKDVAKAQGSADATAATAAATARHREVLQQLGAKAAGAGRELSEDARQRITSTLRNASLDPATRDDLVRGRLTGEPEASGFGLAAGLGAVPRPKRARQATDAGRTKALEKLKRDRDDAREALSAARSRLREAEKEAKRARQEAERVETHAGELADEVSGLETRLQEIQEQLRATSG